MVSFFDFRHRTGGGRFGFEFGNAELAAEISQLIDFDGADNIDEREFFRLSRNDDDARHLLVFQPEIDVDIFSVTLAAHAHDARSNGRAELRSQGFDFGRGIGTLFVEFEVADVD